MKCKADSSMSSSFPDCVFNTTDLEEAETKTSDKPTIIYKLNSIDNHSYLFPPWLYLPVIKRFEDDEAQGRQLHVQFPQKPCF
jgi:hypothetical protein